MTKKRSALNLKWKPVEIPEASLREAQVDGLVAFEECTDYGVINEEFQQPNRITVAPPKNKKRKLQQSVKVSTEPSSEKKRKIKNSPSSSVDQVLAPSTGGCTNTSGDILEEASEKDEFSDMSDYAAWTNYGIPTEIIKALADQKFKEPTEIQSATLPAAILGRRDILGAAETGSGKTLAFGLPILTGILREQKTKGPKSEGKKPLYALILTPTRELAIQIKNHLVAAAKYTGIKVAVIVGGLASVKQERILAEGPEIVVATPGRVWELTDQGNPHLSQITDIRYLAIDETDRMLERGHFEELHKILERLNQDQDKRKLRQNFVFSATLTLVHDLPKHVKLKRPKRMHEMKPEQKLKEIMNTLGVTNPKVVDISRGGGTSATLTECRINCATEEKDYYLYYFLQRHKGRTLVFCNSIGCVKRLANLLSVLECGPLPLHANMHQRQRLKNLDRFRDNENSILIATDVAARGLDIPKVEHVIHYQTPRTSEGYVHRSGRTARASREGITVLFIDPSEIGNYVKMCRTLGKEEDLPRYPVENTFLHGIKQRINLARELDKLQLDIRKANSETGWLQKAAEEMDIIVDDFSTKYDNRETQGKKKILKVKEAQLRSLLSTPIFPKGFSGKFPLQLQLPEPLLPAVELMRNSEAENKKKKKRSNNIPLYKPKKKRTKNNN